MQANLAERGPRRAVQTTGLDWDAAGSSMTQHLDGLERHAGMPATREVVDGALARLRHGLARLELPGPTSAIASIAAQLRDCGAQIGNGELTQLAASLRDRAERPPGDISQVAELLADEVRRTLGWLRIWRALNTPVRERPTCAPWSPGGA